MMLHRTAVLALAATLTLMSASTKAAENDACLICENGILENSGAIINTDIGAFSCMGLAGAGELGTIPDSSCAALQEKAESVCGCIYSNENDEQVETTADRPDGTLFICPLCESDDQVMTNPDATIEFLAEETSCSKLVALASQGQIIRPKCTTIQSQVQKVCGCSAGPSTVDEETDEPPAADGEADTGRYCGICTGTMMSPDATVSIPFQGADSTTCAAIMAADTADSISESDCNAIKSAFGSFDPCGCVDTTRSPIAGFTPEESPSASPIAEEAESTVVSTTSPSSSPTNTPTVTCSVCPDESSVVLRDVVVQDSFGNNVTCVDLAQRVLVGVPSDEECSALQQLVQASCGCTTSSPTDQPSEAPSAVPSMLPSDIPSDLPSLVPSVVPSMVPTLSAEPSDLPSMVPTLIIRHDDCFTDLTEVYHLERLIEDVSIPRIYTLCPETTFSLGHVENSGTIAGGQIPIQLRPNVLYQCGEDGSSANDCILQGGDFGLMSFYGVYDGIYETVESVYLKGITFDSQKTMSVVLEAAGDVNFLDCVFVNQGNMAPILIQWKGDGPPQLPSPSRRLEDFNGSRRMLTQDGLSGQEVTELHHAVTFKGCIFRDNYVVRSLAFPGVIENTFQSDLTIENCLFENNIFEGGDNPAPYGYAIRSLGPLTITRSCFDGNAFQNVAPVMAYTDKLTATMNHVSSNQMSLQCSFVASFETERDMKELNPQCRHHDIDYCAFEAVSTEYPTQAPTSFPTESRQKQGSREESRATNLSINLGVAIAILSLLGLVTITSV